VRYSSEVRIVILAILGLASCKSEPDRWDGFFYPERRDLSKWGRGGPFSDLSTCRAWAEVERFRAERAGFTDTDYECGKNCKPRDGMNVCEETLR
jgi:hypothetical protein